MKSIRVVAERKISESTEKPIVPMKMVFSKLERKGKKVIFVTKF